MTTLDFVRLSDQATLPTRAHPTDAGLDLYLPAAVKLLPGQATRIPLGLSVAIPEGCVGLILDRSSRAALNLKVVGGVIDAGYRGELAVVLVNHNKIPWRIAAGEKVAQLVVVPCLLPQAVWAQSLEESERGENGFGSTDQPAEVTVSAPVTSDIQEQE